MLLAVLLAGRASAAATASYTVSLSSSVPAIGKVASGSVTTNFIVNAANGAISASPTGSTAGQFVPYNATRSSQVTVSVTCSGNGCKNTTPSVTVQAGSTSGRFGTITGFNAVFTSPFTARLSNGQSTASTTGSTLTFTLAAIGNGSTVTFGLGMTVPVTTSGTLGNAAAAYSVTAGTGSGQASANGTVEGRLSISKLSDLSYGTLVFNAGQSGTATWDASTQSFSLSPSNLAVQIHAGPTIGAFKVSGTPFQQLSFSIPSTIQMANAANDPLSITVATTAQGTQSIASDGTFTFYVGGSIGLSSTMKTGAYTGVFTVTANYQ